MKKTIKLFLIFSLSLALVGALILPQLMVAQVTGTESPINSEASADAEKPLQRVQVSPVRIGQLRVSIDVSGEVVAPTNVEVIPEVGGKIVSLPVKIGDHVVRGETLIAAIDQSRPGTPFSNYRLLSSITGTVTSVTAQIGATVSTATPVATVGILDGLQVFIQVPETMIAGLKCGLQAEIRFGAYPGASFLSRIDRLSPVIDPVSRTLRASLKFNRHNERIIPGLFAQVRLFLEPRPRQILVPQESVISDGGKQFVYLYSQGKVVRREVLTGKSAGDQVEIPSGLVAGEMLVIAGQENLEDGMSVTLINSNQAGSQ